MVKLLDKQEVADALDVGLRTVERWMGEGLLPYVRLTRKTVRIRESDLEALIERSVVNAQEE